MTLSIDMHHQIRLYRCWKVLVDIGRGEVWWQ